MLKRFSIHTLRCCMLYNVRCICNTAGLADEKDRRVHGTTNEVVSERFTREKLHLNQLPLTPFDTS